MELIASDLARLTQSEVNALGEFKRYSEARDIGGTAILAAQNGGPWSASYAAPLPPIDLAPAIRIAIALHRGRVAAAPMAGVVTQSIKDMIDEAASIINEGDRERGAALARRNFDLDEEDALANVQRIHDLNWIRQRMAALEKSDEFTPLTPEEVERMDGDELGHWIATLIVSLNVLQGEQMKRASKEFLAGKAAVEELDATVDVKITPKRKAEPVKASAKKRRK